MKDDEISDEDYGEVVEPKSKKRLNIVVSVRFTPDEVDVLRDAIGDDNLSSFIRSTVLTVVKTTPSKWIGSATHSGSMSGVAMFSSTADVSAPTQQGFVPGNLNSPAVRSASTS